MKIKYILILLLTYFASACQDAAQVNNISIIPQPVSMNITNDYFELSSSTVIMYPPNDAELEKAANFIATNLNQRIGAKVQIHTQNTNTNNTISIIANKDIKPESYELNITKDKIIITVCDYSGAIYAMQTLLQLMPTDGYAQKVYSRIDIPTLEIVDYPRFGWRGMHLDVSRHFFPADSIKRYIDYLAMHKINRFHWHFTDDQGWRMESKKYPLLTEISAWRVDRTGEPWNGRKPIDRTSGEEPNYGGFYTQEQIKDIVAYAAERGIIVVPEIEAPGHTSEVFAAYPNLSCLGTKQEVTPGGYYPDDMATAFCAGNEEVFTFLEDIISEIIELFPNSPYIHIGGDEVDKKFWKACPKCQARIKTEGLKNEDELQSYFIKRLEKFISSKGKHLIGWDEILEGGLAPNAIVMSWRGESGGIEAARSGHDVVMTPNNYLYFDYYQNTPENEPQAMSGLITTRKVYEYNPIPKELTPSEAKHVLGAQANLWTEYVPTFSHVEYMTLPRMCALAEVVWSPADKLAWSDFSQRLYYHAKRLDAMRANIHPGTDEIGFTITYDKNKDKYITELYSELYNAEIHYTIDGTEPSLTSPLYTSPFEIRDMVELRAIVVRDGKVISIKPTTRIFGKHKGVGKKITYNMKPTGNYQGNNGDATLIDGITGTVNHSDGYMQGFNNFDFDIVIDLETPTHFTEITASFLQSAGAWVYFPKRLILSTSNDGINYTEAGETKQDYDPLAIPTLRANMTIKGNWTARYLRIVGVNETTRDGLPGAGYKNWIFCDEVFIR